MSVSTAQSEALKRFGCARADIVPSLDSAKRRNDLGCEELEMRLSPPRRQSRRQRPGEKVRERNGIDEIPNHLYRRVGIDDLQKPALPQLLAIAQMLGKWT